MKIKTLQNMVAIKPIQFNHEKPKEAGVRFLTSDKLTNDLVSSEVVFRGPEGLQPGDRVFVTADISKHHNIMSAKYKLNDKEFILVPYTYLLLTEKKDE